MTPSEYLRNAITWELHLDGDITMDKSDGDANAVLKERLNAAGIDFSRTQFLNQMAALRNHDIISTKVTGRRIYEIHLLQAPTSENPYSEPQQPELVPAVPQKGSSSPLLTEDIHAMPLDVRLELITELNDSVREDLQRVRQAL